jgi:peptide/nickel transport system ATP-binding protein
MNEKNPKHDPISARGMRVENLQPAVGNPQFEIRNLKSDELILDVKDLQIHFFTDRGVIRAVEGVDFTIRKQEVWGLVGESASGKSVIGQALVGVVAKPAGRIISGEIFFKGEDILKKNPKEVEKIRGDQIAFIPQDPTTALNPLLRVGFQIGEAFKYHRDMKMSNIPEEIVKVMKVVNIPSPQQRVNDYPHQLSGGLKQRVIIATALSCQPDLLIADEPTSALDVTIQIQIIKLIREIQARFQMTMILITHNLGLVAKMCDRVAVLYCGRIVEEAPVKELFKEPRHPYTRGLLASLPKGEKGDVELYTIPGQLPNPLYHPTGCGFSPRCPFAYEKCTEVPMMEWSSEGHRVRCWRWKEI